MLIEQQTNFFVNCNIIRSTENSLNLSGIFYLGPLAALEK